MGAGGAEEEEPEGEPEEAEGAGEDEGHPPSVGERERDDKGRGDAGADGRAGVEDAHRQRAFAHGEPFGDGFDAGGEIGRLTRAEEKAEERELRGGARSGVQEARKGPAGDKEGERFARAEAVYHPAAHGIHDRVAEEKP